MRTLLIYTTIFLLGLTTLAIGSPQESDVKRGCIASAYQAEARGFDLQENLDACQDL